MCVNSTSKFLRAWILILSGLTPALVWGQQKVTVDVASLDRARILSAAERFLSEEPVTITAFPAERSAGGLHEYFSEGDYW